MTLPGTYSVNKLPSAAPSPAIPSGIKVFDLAAEVRSIASASSPKRTARTLAKLETLRLTLMRLTSGSTIKQHHTDHELSIQTVSGRIVIHSRQERVDLASGQIAVLKRGIVHDVEALEDSAILVTVSVSLGSEGWMPEPSEL